MNAEIKAYDPSDSATAAPGAYAASVRFDPSVRRSILFVAHETSPQVISKKCIAVRKVATPLRELTCHMGSHSVTCHLAEVTFPPLPQPKLVLD